MRWLNHFRTHAARLTVMGVSRALTIALQLGLGALARACAVCDRGCAILLALDATIEAAQATDASHDMIFGGF